MLKSAILHTDPVLSMINTALGQGGETVEIEPGIYICPHFNLGNDILNKKEDYFDFGNFRYGPYGVCDNIEQVKTLYANWLNDPDLDFCISFTPVEASSQPRSGGWRWCKWGEYIGTQESVADYLHDEPFIELIYCYHIYQLLD